MKFSNRLKDFFKTPEALALLVLVALAVILLIINFAFVPIFLNLLLLLIFLGIGFALGNGYFRLSELKREVDFKNLEFTALTRNSKDGIIIYNPVFEILDLNQAAEEIFGLKKKEVVGLKLEPAAVKNPRLRSLAQTIFPSLAPTATQISQDEWPQIVDLELEESSLKLRTVLNQITDEKNQLIGFLKIIQDRTREKDIAESKSEFLTVAAHQLRTPITAIKWSFESLARETKEEVIKTTIEAGRQLSEKMLKIVNDLLEAAKIEEGKFGYKFQDIEFDKFINEIIQQTKVVAAEYGIKISFAAGVKKYKVRIDPEKLSIVFTNILDNAIRYNTKNGRVDVEIKELKEKPFLEISVSDSGVGIPAKELTKLFKKFYRGSNVVKIEPNGSGLGLYIVSNIVKHHGGEIGVESRLGRGSRFWFTLPLDPKLVPQKEVTYEE